MFSLCEIKAGGQCVFYEDWQYIQSLFMKEAFK